jgi:hypothetical protein
VTSAPDNKGDDGRRREPEVEEAFNRLVTEGSNRLDRPLVPLLATGFVGGIDVGVGVLAYLVVYHETGHPLLAAAAFPIGFIALLLARGRRRDVVRAGRGAAVPFGPGLDPDVHRTARRPGRVQLE